MPREPIAARHSKAEWINGADASRILSCAPSTLHRLCVLGLIRVQLEPGLAPRYNRADCERHRGAGGTKARQKKGVRGRRIESEV
jgi:hypothetical protein